ncbi:MAG: 3-phosphoshikimate 1-carboxyvinyltransferase [Candidatus Methanomethylicus sp.]|nr:3-phosphoshikimate 1-carboxyvinyltransferase [Candidatus Methanomethylicus sp.]
MNVRISKSKVRGKVIAPPSKSFTQRAVACALLAGGRSIILNPSASEDGLSSLRAAEMLGEKIEVGDRSWTVSGGKFGSPEDVIHCGGSATTLRLFAALSSLAPSATVLTGDATLRRRPMQELINAMDSLGAECFSTRGNGCAPIVVLGGGIGGGEAIIRGDVSSQFISALLISCTQARKGTRLTLNTPLESKDYVEMTLDVLARFGAQCSADLGRGIFEIPPNQPLSPCTYSVEGDFSSAAFMLAAGVLNGDVEVQGLAMPSRQGDRSILEIVRRMGGTLSQTASGIMASESRLSGISLDARQTPDLVPVIAMLSTRAEGNTTISGIGRLKLKESDRITTIAETINAMGGQALPGRESIAITGVEKTIGAEIDPHNDHRIAMACAILALASEGDTLIRNADCVSKSYPSFFNDLKQLGADVEVFQ